MTPQINKDKKEKQFYTHMNLITKCVCFFISIFFPLIGSCTNAFWVHSGGYNSRGFGSVKCGDENIRQRAKTFVGGLVSPSVSCHGSFGLFHELEFVFF